MPRGGKRPGAGYPKGKPRPSAVNKQMLREAMFLIYTKHAEEMLEAQIQAAKGIALIDKKDDTGEKIFDVAPNPNAWKNITEQVIGKPPQEVTGKEGGAIEHVIRWMDEE